MNGEKIVLSLPVSTHSRLKAAGTLVSYEGLSVATVSTHSRLKAAGCLYGFFQIFPKGFNTQPPEGGWPFRPEMGVL